MMINLKCYWEKKWLNTRPNFKGSLVIKRNKLRWVSRTHKDIKTVSVKLSKVYDPKTKGHQKLENKRAQNIYQAMLLKRKQIQ